MLCWKEVNCDWFSSVRRIQVSLMRFYRPHPKDGEGNVFSLSAPGWGGGYPYPIMFCNISQNAMAQPLGGLPCQVQPGGGYRGGGHTPPARSAGGVPGRGVPWQGGTQVRYPLPPHPRQVSWGGGGYPAGGYPGQDNIGSTCYTAGGMPLAFTQEDFLV